MDATQTEQETALAQLTEDRVRVNRIIAEREAAEKRQEADLAEAKARLSERNTTLITARGSAVDRLVAALNEVIRTGNELRDFYDEHAAVRQQAANLGVLVNSLGKELGMLLRYEHNDLLRRAQNVLLGIGRV